MSDFSIDYILNRAGNQYIGTNGCMRLVQRMQLHANYQSYARADGMVSDLELLQQQQAQRFYVAEQMRPVYNWLQYTRYHPPKLPRAMGRAPAKRTPGRLPRIPFTAAQLQALERAYKLSNYLSAEDANKLAESLDLTNTRVKIWFQNRRARERREKREKEESYDSTVSSNASTPEPEVIAM